MELIVCNFVVQVTMVRTIVGVMLVFASISTVSLLALRDQKHRKMLVGTSGMIVTVVMYASPLSIIVSIEFPWRSVTFSSNLHQLRPDFIPL